jgi:SAM-dependent methyltransferase
VNFTEEFIFGTELRERLLTGVLSKYYASLFRRHWIWQAKGEPHFTLQSVNLFSLFFGGSPMGIFGLFRGFYCAEVVRDGDLVLDVGCGDGSLTKRFLAPRAAHVDAVDLEQSAISYASRHNSAPNITYARLDVVNEPLPASKYDVIVFDGALGHLSVEGSEVFLKAVEQHLAKDGVFCGSESLGQEGSDHLQFFDTVDDLRSVLKRHFDHVRLRVQKYPIPHVAEPRVEAYWRCAASKAALDALNWN